MQIAMAISRRRISFFVYTLCMCCVHLRATQRQLHGIIYRLHRPKVRLMYSWTTLGVRCPGSRATVSHVQRGTRGRCWAGGARPQASDVCELPPSACTGVGPGVVERVCGGGCTAARARWRGQRAGACVGREGHGGGGGGGEWGVSSLLKYLCRQGCVRSLLLAFPPNEIFLHHTPGPTPRALGYAP